MSAHTPDLRLNRLIEQRRKTLGIDDGGPVWGLALSGGGIRSATFCFGLLRALAAQRLLLRFDLLSTVSGGGYIGAMLGRLFSRARSKADIESIVSALAQGDTQYFAQWLRANGRYLTPSGIVDRFYAFAVYARNVVSLHVELGVIGLSLGAAITALDLIFWAGLDSLLTRHPEAQFFFAWWRGWVAWVPSLWLLLLIIVVPAAIVLGLAFQAVALMSDSNRGIKYAVVGASFGAIGAIGVLWHTIVGSRFDDGADARTLLLVFGIVLGVGWPLAVGVAQYCWWREKSAMHERSRPNIPMTDVVTAIDIQDAARSDVTKALAHTFQFAVAVVVLGAVDRIAWWLAYEQRSWQGAGWMLAGSVAALRALVPQLGKLRTSAGSGDMLWNAASLLGRLVTFALVVWWVAVVHRTVMSSIFHLDRIVFPAAVWPLALLSIACILYSWLTGSDNRFINASSLHVFYRARLIRSYLGAVNPGRFGLRRHSIDTVSRAPADWTPTDVGRVGDVDPDDDIHIRDYAPHAAGGPVHLINVCVNETKDPRGGLFNADRRGRVATIGPLGYFRLGQRAPQQLDASDGSLTLGSWTAISGAAVAPGMGGKTRGGLPALAMFAGARLGYWWSSSVLTEFDRERPGVARGPGPQFRKARALVDEARGRFEIAPGKSWYLSDGGHFENTGAYALLAARTPLIVIADCGADPGYGFDDLENLVRKARIDLSCDITFLKPLSASKGNDEDASLTQEGCDIVAEFGSLNDLASEKSQACLALARIDYLDESRTTGTLVVVKPNLCAGLPVDLFNFKAKQPAFPQQSTADQFFDEAQWESYFQLGSALGRKLSDKGLAFLMQNQSRWFEDDDGSPVRDTAATAPKSAATPAGPVAASGRLPARLAATGVGATLGLGAIATAGLGAWQGIDVYRAAAARQRDGEHAALKEIVDLWSRLPAGNAASNAGALGALAGSLARASDTLCTGQEQGWFNKSPLAMDVLGHTRDACLRLGSQAPPACLHLVAVSDPETAGTRATCLANGITDWEARQDLYGCSNYWGFDYSVAAMTACGHAKLASTSRWRELQSRYVLAAPLDRAAYFDPFHPVASLLRGIARRAPCDGITIRPLLYGSTRLGDARVLAAHWSDLGASIAGTVDIVVKASTEGRPFPHVIRTSTIQYSDNDPDECVQALESAARGESFVRATERSDRLPSGVINVWITSEDAAVARSQLEHAKVDVLSREGPPDIKPLLPMVPVAPGASAAGPAIGDPAAPCWRPAGCGVAFCCAGFHVPTCPTRPPVVRPRPRHRPPAAASCQASSATAAQ